MFEFSLQIPAVALTYSVILVLGFAQSPHARLGKGLFSSAGNPLKMRSLRLLNQPMRALTPDVEVRCELRDPNG